jgi:hypothetical protein
VTLEESSRLSSKPDSSAQSADSENHSPSGDDEQDWLASIVSRETYAELIAKAESAGIDPQGFIGNPKCKVTDGDIAELRFNSWLNKAKQADAKTKAVAATQDKRGGN